MDEKYPGKEKKKGRAQALEALSESGKQR